MPTGIYERKHTREMDIKRFMKYVKINQITGCHEWHRYTDHGYGQFSFHSKMQRAHRVAWVLFRGEIPNGMQINHICDVRSCVNIHHLKLGTNQSNMADMANKGRGRTSCKIGILNNSAKLTENDIRMIRMINGTNRELAERFGVSLRQICNIRNHKQWQHIE